MAELFISTNQAGLEIYPNPELKPESGWSSEIGIKQGVKIGNWMGYIDVAAFIQQYDDMMEFSFGQWGGNTKPLGGLGFKSLNVGKTQISGVELSLSGQGKINPDLTINVIAGYTYMRPISLSSNSIYAYGINHGDTSKTTYVMNDVGEVTDTTYTLIDQSINYNNSSSDSTILKYRYKNIAKLDLEIKYKKLSFGGSFRYNDFMSNIDRIFTNPAIGGDEGMIPGINSARDKFKDGDLVIDLRAGYQMTKTARLGFIVNNLLNREYMSRPANMMPPRTFAMQLALKI